MKQLIAWRENLYVAMGAIRSNKLRSVLTMSIIAIGIMALVGIFTAIDALKGSITDSFSAFGAGSFTIETRQRISVNGKMVRNVNFSYTTYDQAVEFQERFSIPSSIGLSITASGAATIKYLAQKTNPNIRVNGINENSLRNMSSDLDRGRNFSLREIEGGRNVIILGADIIKRLFPSVSENPIGKYVSIAGIRYEVIGTLQSKGSGMGMSQDGVAYIPITTARANFIYSRPNVSISIVPSDPRTIETAKSEAEGVFRIVRGLTAKDESDFIVVGSDSMAAMLMENLSLVTLSATLIGLITLCGAAIGLMNIMLVSVGERTREIGTRKALGARPSAIRSQFLFEAIVISQMGGIVGIILGIVIGNVVTLITGGAFLVPWGWMIGGVMICLAVGVASGYLPANKAAKMDPVDALRYE